MRARRAPAVVAALVAATLLAGCEDDGAPRTPADGPAVERSEPDADREPSAPGGDGAGDPADASGATEAQPPPTEVEPFTDADELASTLATAEAVLADPETSADHVAGWARIHQQAYRDLADRPDWREQARGAVPEELRDAHDLTLRAVERLLELTEPQPELPDWRIEPPPPAEELREHYLEAEEAFGVPGEVLAAIHLVETRFGRIQGDSHAGAQGPMQFMPPTWEAYGEGDVTDPRDAILAAGRYLAASGAPDDLEAAVFAYNRSERYVEAVLAHAEAMERHEHYLDVYHGWQVYYRTVDGDVLLEESG
jgi:hypothetical protein